MRGVSSYLEFQTMDKVHKPSDSNYYTKFNTLGMSSDMSTVMYFKIILNQIHATLQAEYEIRNCIEVLDKL
jgi:hypothetical protein